MRRIGIMCMGGLLFVLSVVGVVRGVRAGISHCLYYQAKYGSASDDARRILRRSETAHRFYAHNYHLAAWAAQSAQQSRSGLAGDEAAARKQAAVRWCDRSIDLNPHKRETRLLKARLLAETDPAAAAEHWARYVDWDFWDPFNHAVMADLHAQAGNFAEAYAAVEWTEGSPHHQAAQELVRKATLQDMQLTPPPVLQ